ncbi:MAG: nucleoside deaminase [Polyangiaceae bacterium]|jgi:tRNA(Arg) A34 adenosine deaminase TadA
MGSTATSLVIEIPAWVDEAVAGFLGPLLTDSDRMALAIALSRQNIERGGGPFGAAVFSGSQFVAAGVNRVVDTGFSIAHAEILALMRAQRASAATLAPWQGPYTLVTTTEPCCQCFGALVWSGVERLVCGATTDDAESVGFDEGPKPDEWHRVLERRGIRVTLGVRREEARAVLVRYVEGGGTIYGLQRSGHASSK